MLKVAKFGGSSMADAGQYEKVHSIVQADPARRVVVVSAAGKRSSSDHKITDLLYLCYAHLQYGVDCQGVFDMIADRYRGICSDLSLKVDIEGELSAAEPNIVSAGLIRTARTLFKGQVLLPAELDSLTAPSC